MFRFLAWNTAPVSALLITLAGLTSPALSATPEGVWLTPPDRKGQTAHVAAQKCGPAYCGTIIRVFDASGSPVAAPTVGKRVFWDMAGSGSTYQGSAFVPAHNRTYDARMEMRGDRMKVSGCLGLVCQSQVWQRVR